MFILLGFWHERKLVSFPWNSFIIASTLFYILCIEVCQSRSTGSSGFEKLKGHLSVHWRGQNKSSDVSFRFFSLMSQIICKEPLFSLSKLVSCIDVIRNLCLSHNLSWSFVGGTLICIVLFCVTGKNSLNTLWKPEENAY